MSKKIVYKHKAELKDGEITMQNIDLWKKELASLNDGPVFLTISTDEGYATTDQYGYYGVIMNMTLQTEEFGGWSKTDLHAYLKDAAGLTKSASDLTRKEMKEYIDFIKDYLLINHSVVIPDKENYAKI